MWLTAEQLATLFPQEGKFHDVHITNTELYIDGVLRATSNGSTIKAAVWNRTLTEQEVETMAKQPGEDSP